MQNTAKIIWVIDDDTAILEAVEAVLNEEGYAVSAINDPSTLSALVTEVGATSRG